MQTRKKVVLYGDSVVLTVVGASLKTCPALEVVNAYTPRGALRDLDALSPAAVVLDLGLVGTDFAFALLRDRPDLLLVGLDSEGDRLLVLSGRHARALSTADLVRLIATPAEASEEESARSDRLGDVKCQPPRNSSGRRRPRSSLAGRRTDPPSSEKSERTES